jgi:class 3 adenylate cyclase/tetratricopeptide (TPR) repeat protein
MADDAPDGAGLRPYVSDVVDTWPPDVPLPAATVLQGTLAFVDISGFTRLTEALSVQGKAGAEELAALLDATFAELLAVAFDAGAELVKWGGDAVLLLFSGDAHAPRAVAAARQLQRVMTRVGSLRTSVGRCRLRMSVAVHSGDFEVFLVGSSHRELLLTGPAATVTAGLESTADAGDVLVSPATAALLPAGTAGPAKGAGFLVRATPRAPTAVPRAAEAGDHPVPPPVDRSAFLPPALRRHLAGGRVDSEHRLVAVAFLEFSGVDELLARAGREAVAAALHGLVTLVQERCVHHDVTFWESDIGRSGGKLMLVAGAPASGEDDIGRLLSVVREVLDAGGPLGLRAGVAVGRVFAGDFGPARRRTYSVKGDAVNLAARLTAHAGPGQVYASSEAVERSRTGFGWEPVEPFAVKGKTAPVQAHRLGGSTAAHRDADELAPLAGRDEELGELTALLEAARAGSGACVELVGPPGIGKSRLVDELRERAAGCVVLETRCDEYRAAFPYAPWRDLVRQCLALDDGTTADRAGTVLLERLRISAPELLGWSPLLAAVLGADVPATPEVGDLDDRFRRDRLEQAVLALLRSVLPEPAVVVVDDAHLLDEASAALLGRLAGEVGTTPWLVVLARRAGAGPVPPRVERPVRTLELAPLPEEVVAQLLHAVTGAQPLPPHRRAAMVARSGGNPLFLLELVAARDLATGGLPDTVEQVLTAQIDRLSPADRGLLRAASVLGTHVRVAALRGMVDRPVPPEQLERLGDHLVPDGPDALRFRHGLVREAAYEGLPYARRRALHAAAGAALLELAAEGEDLSPLLAVHFVAAGDHAAAWQHARVAGDRSAALYANVEAAEFYERALTAARALPDVPADELARVAESMGDARTHLGEFAAAETAFRQAAERAPDTAQRARLGYKIALTADRRGDYRRCLQRLSRAERLLDGADGTGPASLRAQVRAQYGLVRHRQGRGRDAVRLLREAVAMAESTGSADILATALLYLDIAELTIGHPGEGEHAHRALSALREAGEHPWLEARALNQLGIRAYFAGRWAEAVERYAASRAACERAGDSWTAAVASANIAEVLSDQGHLAAARTALEGALHTYRAAGTSAFVADGTRLLGRLAGRQGDHRRGELLLVEARECYAADGETLQVLHTDALLAEAALLAGEAGTARERAEAALLRSAALPGRGLVTPLLLRVLGLALAASGDVDAATARLAASIEEARQRSATYDLALSLRALGQVAAVPVPDVEAEADALFTQLGIVARGA